MTDFRDKLAQEIDDEVKAIAQAATYGLKTARESGPNSEKRRLATLRNSVRYARLGVVNDILDSEDAED